MSALSVCDPAPSCQQWDTNVMAAISMFILCDMRETSVVSPSWCDDEHTEAEQRRLIPNISTHFRAQKTWCTLTPPLRARNKTNSWHLAVSTLPTGCIVYFCRKIYIFISLAKSPFTCFSKVSFQVCCVHSFSCSRWAALAPILKSYFPVGIPLPRQMCKWCRRIAKRTVWRLIAVLT